MDLVMFTKHYPDQQVLPALTLGSCPMEAQPKQWDGGSLLRSSELCCKHPCL